MSALHLKVDEESDSPFHDVLSPAVQQQIKRSTAKQTIDNRSIARQYLSKLLSINSLLVFMPISVALRFLPFHESSNLSIAQFVTACLAIVPLAGIMGDCTEVIADSFGPGIGGLLNASLGNAAELILACFGVFKGLDRLIKASLCGSIIGNILLVLGGSILTGGLRYSSQPFATQAAHSEATMAVVAAVAFLVPAIYHSINEAMNPPNSASGEVPANHFDEQKLSLGIAILLMVTYCLMLWFQLRTHAMWFNYQDDDDAIGQSHEEIKQSNNQVSNLLGNQSNNQSSNQTNNQSNNQSPINAPPILRKPTFTRMQSSNHSIDPLMNKFHARRLIREQSMKQSIKKSLNDRFQRSRTMDGGRPHQSNYSYPVSDEDDEENQSINPSNSQNLRLPHLNRPSSIQQRRSVSMNDAEIHNDQTINESIDEHIEEALDHEEMSMKKALILLTLATAGVALLSEILTDSVESAGKSLGLSELFLGVIVVAIVGNAAEHSTALLSAYHNHINVSISIAFGSALQIAMFVVPFIVMISYARDGPPMNMILSELEVFAVCVSVVLSWMCVAGGALYWLLGLMLCMIYVILGLAFFFLPEQSAE